MSREPTGTSVPLDLLNGVGDAMREFHATRRDAEQDQGLRTAGLLHDLVGDATNRTSDISVVENDAGTCSVHKDPLPRLAGRA